MKPVVVRFALVAVLFAGMMIYQAYLAMTVSEPIIVSRSQLLTADVIVVVDLKQAPKKGESLKAKVKEVLLLKGGLPSHLTLKKDEEVSLMMPDDEIHGWKEAGTYLFPIRSVSETWALAPVPPSPGYPDVKRPPKTTYVLPRTYRIYRDTPDVRAQLAPWLQPKR